MVICLVVGYLFVGVIYICMVVGKRRRSDSEKDYEDSSQENYLKGYKNKHRRHKNG